MLKIHKMLVSAILAFTLIGTAFPSSVLAVNTNLAFGKKVTVSSFDSPGYEGSKIVDGIINDRHEWYSWDRKNEWACIDLGTTQSINSVKIYWGAGYAKTYRMQGSNNGTTFNDIPGASVSQGIGGIVILNFSAVTYRYIRLYTTSVPVGSYGNEIMEMEIYSSDQPVVSKPAVPSGLAATAMSASSIQVRWNAVSNADGYKLYRNGVQVAIYTGTQTSYTDVNLNANTRYTYQVSAYNTAGESAKSASVAATTQTLPSNTYKHIDNHVYFDDSQSNLTDAQIKAKLDQIAKPQYQFKYLFIRIAGVDNNGNPTTGDVNAYRHVGHWIKITREYYPNLRIIGVINSERETPVNAGGNAHNNIVKFAKKACGVNGEGFAYNNVNYSCDGVHFDLEPTSRINLTQVNALFSLVRSAVGRSKILGVAASAGAVNASITNNSYNGKANDNWAFSQITTMAKNIDIFAVMAYDQCWNGSVVTSEATYQTYCKNLAIYYAEAVHAQKDRSLTNNALSVQVTVPMYDDRVAHKNSIETPKACMRGIMEAINVNTAAAQRCQSAGVFYGGFMFGWVTSNGLPYTPTQLGSFWENCWVKGNMNY